MSDFDRHSCDAAVARGKLRTGYNRTFECGYCRDCGEWIFFNKRGEPYFITDDIPDMHPDYVKDVQAVPEEQTGI